MSDSNKAPGIVQVVRPPIPGWIMDDPIFKKHTPKAVKMALMVIASRCTYQLPDGSITGCVGGKALEQALECSSATFWRYVDYLVDHRWLAIFKREGPGGRLPNIYGLPGAPRALDRDTIRLVPAAEEPDDQRHLWEAIDEQSQAGNEDHYRLPTPSQIESTPTLKLSVPPSHFESTPTLKMRVPPAGLHIENAGAHTRPVPVNPVGLNTGTGFKNPDNKNPVRTGRKRTAALSINTMDNDDLDDFATVMELYSEACDKGQASRSEAGLLRFVAIVERARRIADNPAAMVVSFLAKPAQQQNIIGRDEDRAIARLKAWRSDGIPQPVRTPDPEPGEIAFTNTATAEPTHDEPVDEPVQDEPQALAKPTAPAPPQTLTAPNDELSNAKAFVAAMPAEEREAARLYVLASMSQILRQSLKNSDPTQTRSIALAIYRARVHAPWTKAADDPAV